MTNVRELLSKSKYDQVEAILKTAGRIVSQRRMGKASFIHIQDLSGKIQVYLKHDILPKNIYDEVVMNLDLGDIIGCSGEIFITKTKELSIKAYKIS